MALAIIMAVALGVALLLLLARYAKDPAVLRAEHAARSDPSSRKPQMDPRRLRVVVSELLRCMGLRVIEEEPLGRPGASRLVALGRGVLRDTRHIVYIEADPAGRVVEAATLLELAEDVAHSEASVGVVVTPYRIDRSGVAGLEVKLELIDGAALVQLLNGHLPARAAEMQRYCSPSAV